MNKWKPGMFSRRPIKGEALINAWPGGSRRITCLGCPATFVSHGKGHRMCDRCKGVAKHRPDVSLGKRNGSVLRGPE